MKKILFIAMACGSLFSAPAQLFSPESWNGAFWGALIGGLAGGHGRHGLSGEGAAIGAGVGLVAGAIAGEARRSSFAYPSYSYSYCPGYSGAYVYYAPNAYCAPGYYYQPMQPNYAVGGTLVGAASGALIGAASHRPGQGAVIGAATGFVAGTVAEATLRQQQRSAWGPPMATVKPQGASGSVPAQAAGPSGVFVSTAAAKPAPQISDAPRVPDPPRF